MGAIGQCERIAHAAFETAYRELCFEVVTEKVFNDFRRRFFRSKIPDSWQERRKALISTACHELHRTARVIPMGKARSLIAAKFDGTPLGVEVNGKPAKLRFSAMALYRAYRKRAHRNPDVLEIAYTGRAGAKTRVSDVNAQ